VSVLDRVRERLRSRRPPADLLAVLEPGERAVSWAVTRDGATVAATTLGLWLPAEGGLWRLGWHEVHRAVWEEGRLTVVGSRAVLGDDRLAALGAAVVEDAEPVVLRLAEPRDLPPEVRTRVTRSVGYSTYHPLPGGGVRVVGRRVPGRDGLSWVLRFDPGTDRDDERVRRGAGEALATALATVGPPAE